MVRLRVGTPDGWARGLTDSSSRDGPQPRHVGLDAVIDTGAMVSAIPATVLEALGCPAFGAVSFQSVIGPHDTGGQVVGSYAARLTLPGLVDLKWVQVLGVQLDTALLGMDVLEHLVLELDGPGETFTLRRPAATEATP